MWLGWSALALEEAEAIKKLLGFLGWGLLVLIYLQKNFKKFTKKGAGWRLKDTFILVQKVFEICAVFLIIGIFHELFEDSCIAGFPNPFVPK